MKFQNLEFGTSPVFLHSHGWGPHPEKTKMFHIFNQIKQKLLSEPSQKTGSIPDLTIIAFNNKKQKYALEECLDHFEVPYLCLGKNVKKFNLADKLDLTFEALKNIKTKYILAADAKDVLMLDHPNKALEIFKKEFNCKMLFQASLIHFPTINTKEFEESVAKTDFKYLNGGLCIGETKFLKKIYKEATGIKLKEKGNEFSWSEQQILKQLYKKHYPQIQIDQECRIFQSLKRVNIAFHNNDCYTQILKGYPYFLNYIYSVTKRHLKTVKKKMINKNKIELLFPAFMGFKD
jgi:hypothetical protein